MKLLQSILRFINPLAWKKMGLWLNWPGKILCLETQRVPNATFFVISLSQACLSNVHLFAVYSYSLTAQQCLWVLLQMCIHWFSVALLGTVLLFTLLLWLLFLSDYQFIKCLHATEIIRGIPGCVSIWKPSFNLPQSGKDLIISARYVQIIWVNV